MKRFFTFLVALVLPLTLLAQTPQEDYVRRYNNLVGRVGLAGVGVETLLDRWAEDYPEDQQQYLARFSFWFTKAQTTSVIQLPQDRYLGREPLLPMTDSLGRKNNFFEDTAYDDEMFGQALDALDKAIALEPKKLDLRLLRIDALTAYEKGSPDMALSALKALVDENFFRLGTDSSAEAFKSLSEHMLTYKKDDPMFLDNLGSYWLVSKKDYRKAQKYYDQVLKKHPDDNTAIRNGILLARNKKDVKLEKKYLAMMAQHGATETDKASASARLQALNQKK